MSRISRHVVISNRNMTKIERAFELSDPSDVLGSTVAGIYARCADTSRVARYYQDYANT